MSSFSGGREKPRLKGGGRGGGQGVSPVSGAQGVGDRL